MGVQEDLRLTYQDLSPSRRSGFVQDLIDYVQSWHIGFPCLIRQYRAPNSTPIDGQRPTSITP